MMRHENTIGSNCLVKSKCSKNLGTKLLSGTRIIKYLVIPSEMFGAYCLLQCSVFAICAKFTVHLKTSLVVFEHFRFSWETTFLEHPHCVLIRY